MGRRRALLCATYFYLRTLRCSCIERLRRVESSLVDNIFDSPWRGCSAFSLSGALVAEAPLFSHLAILNVFQLIKAPMTRVLLNFSETFLIVTTNFFCNPCNLLILLTRLVGIPVQHAQSVYFSHVCGLYFLLTTYWR